MTLVKYILSLIFRLIVYIRNFLYNSQIIKPKNLNCKVISVGNVSVGGTGKTSFTEYIASYFMRRGKFPAVISKGYGRKDKDIKVAETGFRNEQGELTSENFGDEPLM
ncbi:MAG: tetraacyldisaccharide 4'-kinase, partial [Ignavibacteria bacterium]|nr:tetraacyldisaccharide 4'-kinase [Ignavibacteria bacterium]